MAERKARYGSEQRIDGWVLGELLGIGGNSEVWAATRDDDYAALKISYGRRGREPYERFKTREVPILRDRLRDVEGVLPVLDAHTPAHPTRDDPAWLSMPVARQSSDALRKATLAEVVSAIGRFAQTLADIAERFQVAHRDLKPGNLFEYEGVWVLGDFGLAKAIDSAPITADETKLGPAHFIAPEMIIDAANADPYKADVYSLAKTLFALATGMEYPPPGPHRVDTRGYRISDFVGRAGVEHLDLLVERSTDYSAGERPTMHEFAAELAAWSTQAVVPSESRPVDPSVLAARARSVLAPGQRENEKRQRALNAGQQAAQKLLSSLVSFRESLRGIGIGTELQHSFGLDGPAGADIVRADSTGTAVQLWLESYWVEVKDPQTDWPIVEAGFSLGVFDDGTLDGSMQVHFAPSGVMNQRLWGDSFILVPAAGAQQELEVQRLANGLAEQTSAAAEKFLDIVEDANRVRETPSE